VLPLLLAATLLQADTTPKFVNIPKPQIEVEVTQELSHYWKVRDSLEVANQNRLVCLFGTVNHTVEGQAYLHVSAGVPIEDIELAGVICSGKGVVGVFYMGEAKDSIEAGAILDSTGVPYIMSKRLDFAIMGIVWGSKDANGYSLPEITYYMRVKKWSPAQKKS
jgi:hypothetical protein